MQPGWPSFPAGCSDMASEQVYFLFSEVSCSIPVDKTAEKEQAPALSCSKGCMGARADVRASMS